jgi:hypothetical protein
MVRRKTASATLVEELVTFHENVPRVVATTAVERKSVIVPEPVCLE